MEFMNTELTKQIEEFIQKVPESAKEKFMELRAFMQELLPGAKEGMHYGVLGYSLSDNVKSNQHILIAGFKNHVGFYPHPDAIAAFKEELSSYSVSKGAIRFPLTKPLPRELIRKMVRFRQKQLSS